MVFIPHGTSVHSSEFMQEGKPTAMIIVHSKPFINYDEGVVALGDEAGRRRPIWDISGPGLRPWPLALVACGGACGLVHLVIP